MEESLSGKHSAVHRGSNSVMSGRVNNHSFMGDLDEPEFRT